MRVSRTLDWMKDPDIALLQSLTVLGEYWNGHRHEITKQTHKETPKEYEGGAMTLLVKWLQVWVPTAT